MQSVFRPCSNLEGSISELWCWQKYNFTKLLMIFRNILAKKSLSFSEICSGLIIQWHTSKRVHSFLLPVTWPIRRVRHHAFWFIFRLYQFKIATTAATNRFESLWDVPSEYLRQWSFSKKSALVNFSVKTANYFKIECKNLFPIFCVVKVLR